MNSYTKKISFALILILFSIAFAFQSPPPKPQELPASLVPQKQQADAFVIEGLWDEALSAYRALQAACIAQGFDLAAVDLYEERLMVVVLRDDLEFEDKLAQLQAFQYEEQHPYFEGLYQGALAHFYIYYEEVDSFQKYYDLASRSFQQEKRFLQEANMNANLAHEFYILDDIQNTKLLLEKAEQLFEQKLQPNGIEMPTLYNLQTIVSVELGDYEKALQANLMSLKLVEENPHAHPLDLVYEYNNLATTYSYLSDYNGALKYYQKALDIVEKDGSFPENETASLLFNMGLTYENLGNNIQTKEMMLQVLKHLEKVPEKSKNILGDYINTYQALFSCYFSFSNLDSAEYYLDKTTALNKKFAYRESITTSNYGKLYHAKRDFKNARKYYQKALEMAINTYGNKNASVGGLYSSIGDLDFSDKNWLGALTYSQKALEAISVDFSDHHGISNPKLENILFKGPFLSVLKKKLTIFNALFKEKNPRVTIKDIFNTAKLATETLEQINKSIRDPESKRFWLNNQAIPLFEKAIQVAVSIYEDSKDPNYLNEAFMLSERSKSMLMTGAMQEANASSFGGVPDSLIQQVQELQKKMATAEKLGFDAKLSGDLANAALQDSLIFQYRYGLDILKHTFETQYPQYYDLKYTTNVASIQQIQSTIDGSTNFIEYFEGTEEIYAFSIHKNAAKVITIPKSKHFKLDLMRFQKSLLNINLAFEDPNRAYNEFIEQSYAMYQLLLEPCLEIKSDRLIIIPDGLLGYLPFEALLQEATNSIAQNAAYTPFAELPYLLKDYTISYNYSGTLLLKQQSLNQAAINGKILALAPSYENPAASWRGQREIKLRTGLPQLPGAMEEVRLLSQSFDGEFLTGNQANEQEFKRLAKEHGILHLAMHGLVNHKNPEFSCLAMTEESHKDQDNFLYAYEIKQLALNAELVVLSACETGSGKYQRGEGVVSIGRGFMYAGAPSLIMTLWQLNDQSGAMIIDHFYKNMSLGMDKDKAIREAKLTYLKQKHDGATAHPFLWAAFIQVGDYGAIVIDRKKEWQNYLIPAALLGLLLFIGIAYRRSNRVT